MAIGEGDGEVTTITFAPQVARYVKIIQTGDSSTNWWTIFELRVYKTADTG